MEKSSVAFWNSKIDLSQFSGLISEVSSGLRHMVPGCIICNRRLPTDPALLLGDGLLFAIRLVPMFPVHS